MPPPPFVPATRFLRFSRHKAFATPCAWALEVLLTWPGIAGQEFVLACPRNQERLTLGDATPSCSAPPPLRKRKRGKSYVPTSGIAIVTHARPLMPHRGTPPTTIPRGRLQRLICTEAIVRMNCGFAHWYMTYYGACQSDPTGQRPSMHPPAHPLGRAINGDCLPRWEFWQNVLFRNRLDHLVLMGGHGFHGYIVWFQQQMCMQRRVVPKVTVMRVGHLKGP